MMMMMVGDYGRCLSVNEDDHERDCENLAPGVSQVISG